MSILFDPVATLFRFQTDEQAIQMANEPASADKANRGNPGGRLCVALKCPARAAMEFSRMKMAEIAAARFPVAQRQ
jgi:hypothetical protein